MTTDAEINIKTDAEFAELLEHPFIRYFMRNTLDLPVDECWPWTGDLDRNGYPLFEGERAHRVSWELFNGRSATGLVVRHTCDNPPCVNPYHLVSGTHGDNVRDRVARRRSAKGERNGRAKLTAKQAAEIRVSTLTQMAIANRYGVSRRTVYQIKRGLTWKK